MRQIETAGTMELRLAGTATFIRLPKLLSALEAAPADKHLRIRTRGLRYIDHTFASALRYAAVDRRSNGKRIIVD